MVRYLILAAVCLFVVGCWAFEKTDERPTPISEALGDAAVAFEQGVKQAPPIPGPSGWILGLLFGGTAAVAAFVTKLVSRKKDLDAKAPEPAPSGGAT